MKYLNTFHNYFYWWNLLGLALLGSLLRFYHEGVTIISWPIDSLISAYILSSCLFLVQSKLNRLPLKVVAILVLAAAHWIMTGLFDIVLTRFFRLEEQYSVLELDHYLIAHKTDLIDGLLWGLLYLSLFSWLKTLQKLEVIAEEKKSLEKRLSSSELNVLSNEINPHFIFNAMNGVSMKIRLGEAKLAVKMLASLNDLLRLSLNKENDELISLGDELELLDKYLTIEQVRFGEHFSLTRAIPEEMRILKVPKLILQPLVENAFKHGMNNALERMELKIEGQANEKELMLTVYNSQEEPSKLNYANSNIGLPNVVHRLRSFFGTNFQFQSFREKNGIAFKITLPAIK